MGTLFAVLFFATFVALFGFGLVSLASALGPKPEKNKTKLSSYECGIAVQTTGKTNLPVKFYLTAILFILFDIEIIFMYPWAVSYFDFLESGQGGYALGAMGVFLLIFIFGLFWEVRSKALEWE